MFTKNFLLQPIIIIIINFPLLKGCSWLTVFEVLFYQAQCNIIYLYLKIHSPEKHAIPELGSLRQEDSETEAELPKALRSAWVHT